MEKTAADFAVIVKNGVVKGIGKSVVCMPKINFEGAGIKWMDDAKLLKSNKI